MNFSRSELIAELWRPVVARRWKNLELFVFLEKRPITGKFLKFCSETIHHVTYRCVMFKFREIWPSCVAYLTKKQQKFAWLSCSRYCADRAKNLPQPAANNLLRMLKISSKSVHFRLSYSRTREHRQSALESESNIQLKPSFQPNNNITRI